MPKRKTASQTARGGLKNEQDVADLFNRWTNDSSATNRVVTSWLQAMGHLQPTSITEVVATNPRDTHKRDITVRVTSGLSTRTHHISIKLLTSRRGSGTNHLQRLTLDSFARLFSAPPSVMQLLRLYTGDVTPTGRKGLSDKRRVKGPEFTTDEQQTVLSWLKTNRSAVLSQIFQGEDPLYAPDWILVVRKNRTPPDSVLKSMPQAIQKFGRGEVFIARTSFRIGSIIMQRKGGGRGATDLQFKCAFGKLDT